MLTPGCHHVQTCECLQTLLVSINLLRSREPIMSQICLKMLTKQNPGLMPSCFPALLNLTSIDRNGSQDSAILKHLCKPSFDVTW